MHRPSFDAAWARFNEVKLPVKAVGKKIGGKVEANTNSGIFLNACPIRMSYVLNYTGVRIPKTGYPVVSGADGFWYLFRVNELMSYLDRTFGKPEASASVPTFQSFARMKGIVVVKGKGWSDATGHVTLWNGISCSDSCHLLSDPDNGSFVPDLAKLWTLQ